MGLAIRHDKMPQMKNMLDSLDLIHEKKQVYMHIIIIQEMVSCHDVLLLCLQDIVSYSHIMHCQNKLVHGHARTTWHIY